SGRRLRRRRARERRQFGALDLLEDPREVFLEVALEVFLHAAVRADQPQVREHLHAPGRRDRAGGIAGLGQRIAAHLLQHRGPVLGAVVHVHHHDLQVLAANRLLQVLQGRQLDQAIAAAAGPERHHHQLAAPGVEGDGLAIRVLPEQPGRQLADRRAARQHQAGHEQQEQEGGTEQAAHGGYRERKPRPLSGIPRAAFATLSPCPNCPKSRPRAAAWRRTWKGAGSRASCCAGRTCAGRSRPRWPGTCPASASTPCAAAPSTCCSTPPPAARCCTWACPAACACCPGGSRPVPTTTWTSRSPGAAARCCASTTRAASAACCGKRRATSTRCCAASGPSPCPTTSTATTCTRAAAAAMRR